jgi:hypothetical protein
MSEQDPYAQLGVGEDASFDEIQDARNRLVAAVEGDSNQVEQLEAAYDAVLMHRLKMRQEGRIKVPERIKYAEKTVSPQMMAPTLPLARLPSWLQQLLDRPTLKDVLWPGLVNAGLMAATLLYPGRLTPSLLQLILVAGAGSTVYFLNRKENRLGRAIFIAISTLLLGLLIGGILAALASGLLANRMAESVFATLVTLVVFWLVSGFVK